jgi:hypothetical protein
MTYLDKPIMARTVAAHVAKATNYRTLTSHQHRVAGGQKAAAIFVVGVIIGLWLALWVSA